MSFFSDLNTKVVLLSSLIRLANDTNQVDSVLNMLEKLERPELLEKMLAFARTQPGMAAILQDRPLIRGIHLETLRALPEGTLGREFAEHILKHKLDPNYFATTLPEDELHYVPARLRETHDLWHLATGIDMTPAGELALQGFYMAQIDGALPGFIVTAGLLNGLLKHPGDMRNRLESLARGWVLGRRALPLLSVRWEQLWSTPVTEIRRRYRLDATEIEGFLTPGASQSAAA